MKKLTLLSFGAALILAGCAMSSEQAKTPEVAQQGCPMHAKMGDSMKQMHQHAHANGDMHAHHDHGAHAKAMAENATQEPKSESDIILDKFKSTLTYADVSAYAKGIDVELKGNRALSKKELDEIGKFAAETVRKERGISGKINVYYDFNGKIVKGKY